MRHEVSKKILSGVLSAGLVLSLAACGGESAEKSAGVLQLAASSQASQTASSSQAQSSSSTSEGSTESKEEQKPLKITFLLNADNSGEADEYKQLVADINEYTNMDVTWVFDSSDQYSTDIGLRMVANNLEAVNQISNIDASFIEACNAGVFWDITDYIDDYPNLATIPEIVRLNASVNGRLYGVPRKRDLSRDGITWRQDWLDNLGLEKPQTLEDFYNMLKEFTYGDPDGDGVQNTYGLAMTEYAGPWDVMQLWFGVPNGWGIDENGDLIPAHLTDEYKTALDWFRKLYEEGLINKDFRTTGSDQWDTLIRTQGAGSIVDVLARARRSQSYYDENDLEGEFNMFYAVDAGNGYLCHPTDGFGGLLAISKTEVPTEEELRRVLQFLNDLNDAEMADLIERGYEGINYYITDEGYYKNYTNEEKEALGVTTANFKNGFNQALAYFCTDEETAKRLVSVPEEGLRALETQYMKESEQYVVPNYALSYLKSSATYMELGTQLDKIISEARLDYITGVIDDSGLDNAIDTWLNAGGQKVIDEVNKLYHAAN